jgi:ABC-2 type transport system permease protein
MTTHLFADSATMLRRNLLHARRYPSVTLIVGAVPVIMYLLFVYVFGATLLLGIVGGAQSTAISVSMDMTSGIISRFRTMSIPRAAVLAGHVIGSVVQTVATLLVVVGVALLTGFRPATGPVEWVAALGFVALVAFALTWLSTALGLSAQSVEAASNLPMPLILLPFFGSGFVPTESMPTVVRWFAEYQPFTPMIETLRGLLLGTEVGWNGPIAIGWCVALSILGSWWALRLYDRDPVR